ncbi:derlin-1.2-like [Pistacia vera]|uniref:derlin-1.2-like n=1 Tax=Pistacia vera TaxID=55513 RepID=UPI00126352D3|nr:derlin-1.2-like [Pistacia vera]
MSTPAEFYRSLPPVSKTFGVICLITTAAQSLNLFNIWNIALQYEDVCKRFQVWRLITNFFFLGPFSFPFAFRLIIIAKYGVSLERGPFDKRTADFLWMLIFGAISLLVMAVVPVLWTPFMGASLVFMIVYIWGREFPNARINIYGVVSLKGFYLPWAMLALDLIFGNPLLPDILGMVAGHIYYFLTVLHPLAGGKYVFKTPLWVHKLVAYWGEGVQINSPVQRNPHAGVTFRGRSYRLNGNRSSSSSSPAPEQQPQQPNANAAADGVAFRGRSYRLDGR